MNQNRFPVIYIA